MENRPEKRILGVRWSLLAILLLGTALRFLHLGRQSVSIDEGFSWLAVQMSFGGVTRLSWHEVHPPLYYYLLKASLWVLPDTEFGMRFVSVLCSVAALAVMMTFVYRRWELRAACYVGWLGALSPFDIYYAQEARMYSLLAFLFVLAFTELVEALEGKPAHLIGWVAATTGLAWTHAYGFLAAFLQIGFFAVYWTWQRLRGRPFPLRPKPVVAALAALFLGVGPIVILFYKLRHNGAGSVTVPKAGDILAIVRCWVTGPTDAFPTFKIPWWVHDVSTAVMVGCAVLGARQLWRRDEFHHWILYFAAALIVLPPALVFAFSTLKKHALWVERGFLPNAHILYLLAGIGLSAVGSRALRGIAIAIIAVSVVTGEVYYYTRFEKSLAAPAFHALPPLTPQRALLVTPPWLEWDAYYYLRTRASFWGVESKAPWQLTHITRPAARTPREAPTTCDEPDLQAVSDIYAFGDAAEIRANRSHWPSCLLTKKIWVFEQSRWHPLDR
jgi:mannosyltransferase